jgi:hypothetical protein
MSKESTSPVLKWFLIAVIAISICALGAFVLLMVYPAKEHRIARELQKRGFYVEYERQGNNLWRYPFRVDGENLSITQDDIRLICQLPHLRMLMFQDGDLSGLKLDDIVNCQELTNFYCISVTPFPNDEIRKLAACPIHSFVFSKVNWNDSDLEDFAKWATTVDNLTMMVNAGITDAGLIHLEKIASLRGLDLSGTSVTQEGIDEFQKKRPDVTVIFDGRPLPLQGGK